MRMCKKVCIALVLALALTIGSFAGAAPATPPKSGVDLVILLDNSNSMSTMRPHSDPAGYRFDAAAIMLNMVSLYSSRAAVVPFHRTNQNINVNQQGTQRMVNIAMLTDAGTTDYQGAQNRSAFTADMLRRNRDNNKGESGGTHIGSAMEEAVRLLDSGREERQINGNKPMILLLADGRISVPGELQPANSDQKEKDRLNKALQECDLKDYTVYTVMLVNPESKDLNKNDVDEMMRWAITTGGTGFELSDPTQLPRVFSQMFGHQIGSSMMSVQPTAQWDEVQKHFYIEINIPNQSVEEANILLQTEGLRDVELRKPDGQRANVDNQKVFKPDLFRFVQFKIYRPQEESGKWRLVFNKDANAPDHVAVNVLYNYTETLHVDIDPANGPYHKGDRIHLSAQLFKDGIPSQDRLLYKQVRQGDGQVEGIQAYAYLMPPTYAEAKLEQGAAIAKLELLPSNNQDRFEKTFSLRDFVKDGEAVDKAGAFKLFVRLEGSGLVRELGPVPYEVQNQAPMAIQKEVQVGPIEINDPNDRDYGAAQQLLLELAKYVIERDKDPLTATLASGDPGIIQVTPPDSQLNSTLTTQGKAGNVRLEFKVQDNERANLVDSQNQPLPNGIAIDVEVVSVWDELKKAFAPAISLISEKNENGYFEKNSEVDFEVSISGPDSPQFDIFSYQPVLRVFHVKGHGMTGEDLPVRLTKTSANSWKGRLQLDDRAQYTLRCELWVGHGAEENEGGRKLNETTNTEITTGNEAPAVVQDRVNALVQKADVEPFTLLGQKGTEPWQVLLNDLFEDQNIPYDRLAITIQGGQDVVSFELSEEARDEDLGPRTYYTAVFTPVSPGEASFKITATDQSGATADAFYKIQVESLTETVKKKAMEYGAIALAVLILLLIIRQILKPSFKGMKLMRKRDGNAHSETALPAVKKILRLSQYADQTMLADVQLSKAHLQHIRLKAARNGIWVMLGKGDLRGAIIKVGNETLSKKKKKAKLLVGREVKIENGGSNISWLLEMSQKSAARKGRGATRPASNRRGPYTG